MTMRVRESDGGYRGPGRSLRKRRVAHMFNHGWWRLAVGGWWRLAIGGLRLAVGGSWCLVLGGG